MERNIPFPFQIGAGRKGNVRKKGAFRVPEVECRVRRSNQRLAATRNRLPQRNDRIIDPFTLYFGRFLDVDLEQLHPYPDDIPLTRGVDLQLVRRNKGTSRILSKQAK